MRLLVARHGATQHNLDGRYTGQFDAPLSALGERQADALAARLAPQRFDAIISSDLLRARQTAERVAARSGQEVSFDADLREISMGAWEGQRFTEVKREAGALLAQIETETTGETPYPQGESWAQVSARVLGALRRCQARYTDGYVLWVAHGGVINVLLLDALGLSYERRWQFVRGNTSLFEFEYLPTMVRVVRANDTSHLELLADVGEGERFQAI
jgi:ribonuclease H / adenosylcobalamin/alpha-ribazole phosphatase